jgi:hypothetical protein
LGEPNQIHTFPAGVRPSSATGGIAQERMETTTHYVGLTASDVHCR